MLSVVNNKPNRRILVIDDLESIHADYVKILEGERVSKSVENLEALDNFIFNEGSKPSSTPSGIRAMEFVLDHAYQGEEGCEMAAAAKKANRPYALAFVDMRMPPGWDALQTIEALWKIDPEIQVVICSAYSDKTREDIIEEIGHSDQLIILKKPFDQIEVYQIAAALTEKWNSQAHSKDLMLNLESKVEERTKELSSLNEKLTELNDDLRKSTKEAECAARAKGRFLATMSHEIRTMLNGIMGSAYMLNKANLDRESQDFAQIIQNSGEALMVLINDILDYSKYETGEVSLESVPFSMRELAEDCVALLGPYIRNKNVEFSLSVDRGLPETLVGDPARIRQIILNLLNNAIKFSEGETVELQILLNSEENEIACISIEVLDTGIGISEEAQTRLFNAFMQADSSTTREFGGTGLGLAICHLLTQAMQGSLKVESEEKKGSTFTLELELPIDQTASIPKADNKDSEIPIEVCEGKKILLVDDNPINCKLASRFLDSMNMDIDLCHDGEAAIEMYFATEYDLVLMDLQMPILDGFSASERIREREGPQASRTPIIALTANAFDDIKEQASESGMDDFVTKPLRMTDLIACLSKWLGANRN